jgi:hypothetical protein
MKFSWLVKKFLHLKKFFFNIFLILHSRYASLIDLNSIKWQKISHNHFKPNIFFQSCQIDKTNYPQNHVLAHKTVSVENPSYYEISYSLCLLFAYYINSYSFFITSCLKICFLLSIFIAV